MNQDLHWDQDDDSDQDWVSKSSVKRDMHALQQTGMRLMELNPAQLATIPLTDELIAAIEEARRIKSREARRRHSQYIGKLMRKADSDAIEHAIELLDPSSEAFNRLHQQAERWRDRLLDNEQQSDTLAEWFDAFPDCDRQQLRNLHRNAQREQQKTPDSWNARKKLYQLIRQHLS